jgi:SAM-dependent methyltransferase
MASTTGERQIGHKQDDIAINHRARYEWAAKLLRKNIPKFSHVLDAACGCGYGAKILAQHGFAVTAYDKADEAAKYQKQFHHPRVNFIQADVFDAVEFGQTYDAVVSIETIEHIADAVNWISRLWLSTPLMVGTVPNELIVPFNPKKHPFHHRHYTRRQVEELFRGWELSDWATQFGKYQEYEMRPGDDGMTLGFLAKRLSA